MEDVDGWEATRAYICVSTGLDVPYTDRYRSIKKDTSVCGSCNTQHIRKTGTDKHMVASTLRGIGEDTHKGHMSESIHNTYTQHTAIYRKSECLMVCKGETEPLSGGVRYARRKRRFRACVR